MVFGSVRLVDSETNVPAEFRRKPFLGLSFVLILVLFFTIPGVTEDHSQTHTIADGTIMYFCLCPVLLMIVVITL